MKATRGHFGFVCIALLWVAAVALARPPDGRLESARVALRPAAAPSVSKAPAPAEREPKPDRDETESQPVAVSEPAPSEPQRPTRLVPDAAAGEGLLEGGAFPPLQASYEELGSFSAYARAMGALGARFVVVEDRRIVGEVDAKGEVLGMAVPVGHFSPRARDYSDEPALASARRRVFERFGPGATVMMLVPRELDAALFGSVSKWLVARGEFASDYRALDAHYGTDASGNLLLHVDSGTRLDGSYKDLSLVFDLQGAMGGSM